MNYFLSYCKKYYKNQRNIFLGIFFLIFLIFYFIWGPKVINYTIGAEDFNNVNFSLFEEDHAFFSLKNMENKYVKKTLTDISPGIADQVKNRETVGIFYLYPMENDMYIVIYADKAAMYDTERLYYQNHEKQTVTPITLKGGFAKSDDNVKQYAFEYLHEIDPVAYPSVESMDSVLFPYLFVSNQIGETPMFIIQLAFYIFLFLILLIPVFIYINSNLSNMHITKDCIQRLTKVDQKLIDKEFKSAKKLLHFKVGKHLLFYQNMILWKVVSYQHIVWMYKKKNEIDISGSYSLYLYMDDGSRYRMMLGNDTKKITKLMDIIQNYNSKVLVGYQAQLIDKYKISKKEFLKLIKEMRKIDTGDNDNEKV